MNELEHVTDGSIEAFNHSPLFKTLGFTIVEWGVDFVDLRIQHGNPCHAGSFGKNTAVGINGAIVTAALESAVGISGFIGFGCTPSGVVALDIKMMQIIRGQFSHVKARIDRKTRTMIFASAHLYSERGGLCAAASGIVAKG
ncbi:MULTISPECIES: PaaI family thioesterase [Photorhabdus]|uniref:Thioesterase domain-containing protein n=1 Tax=Photorhabdus asymbiotica subsp. asymbiotica (strain ATCC 43949 / 3105-77) TaxID=553480 RepID=C7BK72_PHOAA|nr:hypothetical protein [Photorhabdus asymbiotica]CAQ84312.1 conserved hypothetical protein [Photorhabdus asymbiotica]